MQHSLEDSIYQSQIAVIEADLHVADGVLADDAFASGLANVHTREARGATEERVGGDAQSRRDRAAQILTLRADHIERGRSAEVYDHAWPAEFFERRHAVHDSVRSHLSGIICQHRHASLQAGLHENGIDVEVALADFAQRGIHGWNDGRDDDVLHVRALDAVEHEQVAEEHTVLIHGL